MTKMCLVFEMAVVPVIENCNQFLYINRTPKGPRGTGAPYSTKNSPPKTQHGNLQVRKSCPINVFKRNWPGNLWMGFTLIFQKYVGRFQSKDFKPRVTGAGMKVEELGIRLECYLVVKNKWT